MIGVDKMYVCLDCQKIFDDPEYWEEKHNLDTPPYEKLSGCPYCGGAYANAYECSHCGDWIVDNYIKIGEKRYCQDCYCEYELGEE